MMMVTTMGSPSGTAETIWATSRYAISAAGRPCSAAMMPTTAKMPSSMMMYRFEKWAIAFVNGLSGDFSCASSAMPAKYVLRPLRTTYPFPDPRTMDVPDRRLFFRS